MTLDKQRENKIHVYWLYLAYAKMPTGQYMFPISTNFMLSI
jgi:hypothetical protein